MERTQRVNVGASAFTLIEVMIALLISAIVIAGGLQLFAVFRSALQSVENQARLEENAAYALRLLTDDIRRAGFWGKHADGTRIHIPATLSIHCQGNNVQQWAAQPHLPIVATNASYPLPCSPARQAAPGSDTLTLRYAGATATTPRTGRIQLQVNTETGRLFNNGNPPLPAESSATHDFHLRAWYIDADADTENQPALRRYTLVDNGLMQNQEILPGVNQLLVSLGIDRDGDNILDGFITADAGNTFPVLAVRIELQLQSAVKKTDSPRSIRVARTIALPNKPQPYPE